MTPRRALTLALALAAAGCTEQHQLAACRGPVVALDTAYWQPSAADLAALDKLCPPEKP